MGEIAVQRNYRDTIFRMLFKKKENLLSLYNALNQTAYTDAVELAVDYCIQNGILGEFLSKNRAEAIAMSIFEYNEEQHMKSEREQAYQNGRKEGENRLVQLLQILLAAGKGEDIERITTDLTYREQLYQENNI